MNSLSVDKKIILRPPKLVQVLSCHSQDMQQNQDGRLRSPVSSYTTVRSEFLNDELNYLKPTCQSEFRRNLPNSRGKIFTFNYHGLIYFISFATQLIYVLSSKQVLIHHNKDLAGLKCCYSNVNICSVPLVMLLLEEDIYQ